jgi:hypothetical protein
VIPWIAHFPGNCNHRRILEIVFAEDANGVKRFEDQVLILPRKSVPKIEGQHHGSGIGLGQPDDLGVTGGGFGQQILVRPNEIGHLHAGAIGELARAGDIPVQVNRLVRVRKDGGDLDLVSILNLEILKCLRDMLLVVGLGNIESQHGTALVTFQAFHIDMAQSAGRQHPAGEL